MNWCPECHGQAEPCKTCGKDANLNESGLNALLSAVVDAAIDLTVFVKLHDYPQEGTADFYELTRLCDVQEPALRAAGFIPAGKIGR